MVIWSSSYALIWHAAADSEFVAALQTFLSYLQSNMLDKIKNISKWAVLEKEPWQSIESLGQEWLIKTQCSPEGYTVMMTDGTAILGERRNQDYVQEKAEE